MSSPNTALWDNLGRTDPSHTKGFSRSGGFRGTAIKPIWSFRRMTEEFGPCGVGWGVGEPVFQVVPALEGEILVYCTAKVWFKREEEVSQHVYGVGGDKVVAKFSSGLKTDDEAFKKAFTDAVTNALKLIGVGADVHMGLFDDSKYVRKMEEEFADEKPLNLPAAKSSAALKREDVWKEFTADLAQITTALQLTKCKDEWRAKVVKDGWNRTWIAAMPDEFEAVARRLQTEADTVSEIEDTFPGSRVVDERYTSNLMAG